MPLINCKDCGSAVSTEAKACPKCGARMPRKTSLITKVLAGVIATSMAVAITGWVMGPPATPEDPAKAAALAAVQAQDDQRRSAGRAFVNALQRSARDPESMVFEWIGINPDASLICATFRAKNGFGGTTKEAVMAIGNGAITRADTKAWQKHCTGLIEYTQLGN